MRTMKHWIGAVIVILSLGGSGTADETQPAQPKEAAQQEQADLQALIRDLGADDFRVRELATQGLIQAGNKSLPLLKRASQSPDPEVRWRAQKAIEEITREAAADAGQDPDRAPAGEEHTGRPSPQARRPAQQLSPWAELFGGGDPFENLLPPEIREQLAAMKERMQATRQQLSPGGSIRLQPGMQQGMWTFRLRNGRWESERRTNRNGQGEVEREESGTDRPMRVGVAVTELSPLIRAQLRLAPELGIAVTRVHPGSIAERLGLQAHDIVTHIDGQALTVLSDIRALAQPGTHKVKILRAAAAVELEVTVD